MKIRTGCQYVGYFYYSEHLKWVAQNLRLGRGLDIAALEARAVRVFISALFKRTATITQAGVESPTLRSGTVAFNLCVAPLMSRI